MIATAGAAAGLVACHSISQIAGMIDTAARAPHPPVLPPRRVLLLANANSRRGHEADQAEAALVAAGLAVDVVRTRSRGEATPAIEAAATRVDAIVTAGGDGTANAAAEGVLRTGKPLGILPMGTANDLAKTLHLPLDLPGAAATIAAGHVKPIDLGDVNGHLFFNVASLGLSADLAAKLTAERKRRFGRLAYALTAVLALLTARPFNADIVTRSGSQRVRTLQIAVGNGRYYGGGMAVEADARIDDGTLDLYSLEFEQVWKLALLARSLRAGQHGLWAEVRTEKCVTFDVLTRTPRPINTDGELTTFTPARFQVRAKAVAVFVPAPLGSPSDALTNVTM
jgi:YegS/Rv2252/BmrU family lipid kinase